MKHIFTASIFAIVASFVIACKESRVKEHKEWEKAFADNNFRNACFIMRDNNHETIHFLDKEKCLERRVPGNTFNLFSAMVAMEVAVANDDQLVIKPDSSTVAAQADNMHTAFQNNNEYYFKQLISRIGQARMQKYLDTSNYGNRTISKSPDYWFDGTLRISPDEQVGLLKRMYFFELPFQERTQRIAKTLMSEKEGEGLYYTSSIINDSGRLMCYIAGFAEHTQHVKEMEGSMNKSDIRVYPYFFACSYQIDETSRADAINKGKVIINQILKSYGAFNDR